MGDHISFCYQYFNSGSKLKKNLAQSGSKVAPTFQKWLQLFLICENGCDKSQNPRGGPVPYSYH